MKNNPSFEGMLKRMIVAPASRRDAAVQAAMAQLDGKPPDALLYKAAQAAHLLSMSQMSLWRLRKSGALDTVKILGSTRYRRCDIERLAQGTVAK